MPFHTQLTNLLTEWILFRIEISLARSPLRIHCKPDVQRTVNTSPETQLHSEPYESNPRLYTICSFPSTFASLRNSATPHTFSRFVEWKRDVMAHAQKPDSVFQRNWRVHLYRRGCQFSRVLAFLEWGSAENGCSNTGWTVPSQAEDCWLPTPFAPFPFTSPPVRHRVPPDSVSTLPKTL